MGPSESMELGAREGCTGYCMNVLQDICGAAELVKSNSL